MHVISILLVFLAQLHHVLAISEASERQAAKVSRKCSGFDHLVVPDAIVISVTSTERFNVTVKQEHRLNRTVAGLDFCDVSVILTHPGVDDRVLVSVWLPLEGWNGRFQGTGGGGFATGLFDPSLADAVDQGYSAASTDGGHSRELDDVSEWALKSDGSIDLELFIRFSTKSLHDMTVVGKAITTQYYGTSPSHSYWNGCSTGGRQGYMIAQKYPDDYDGILANAPAIYFTTLVIGDFFPQTIMQEINTFPSLCEFDYFTQSSISHCDTVDGVKDSVVIDPLSCQFDPYSLVGHTIECEEKEQKKNVVITSKTAEIYQKIIDGPYSPFGQQIWPGFPHGTSLHYIANTTVTETGRRVGRPFPISAAWIQYFLEKSPRFDVSTLKTADMGWLMSQAKSEYGWIIDAESPDLSAFRAAGRKLISWHGLIDPLIPARATIQYFERLQIEIGSADEIDTFFRLFLVPGVEHCGEGPGPIPSDPLAALVDWVEKGKAPDTLHAAATTDGGQPVHRRICRYPYQLRYVGDGDPNREESWICSKHDPMEVESFGRNIWNQILGGAQKVFSQQ